MTKSFHGSPKDWDRISSPLKMIDPILENFANEKGLQLNANTKNWPDRELRWTHQIERRIHIYLENENELTWSLCISICQFRNSIHMQKDKIIFKEIDITEMRSLLPEKLEEAYEIVTGWNAGDL